MSAALDEVCRETRVAWAAREAKVHQVDEHVTSNQNIR